MNTVSFSREQDGVVNPPRRKRVIIAVITLCVALTLTEAIWIKSQQTMLQALLSKQSALADERDSLLAKATAVAKELAAAEQQLATIHAETAAATERSNTDREVEIRFWIQRLKKLRTLFTDRREQSIPELALLKDSDWLRIAKENDVDTPEHARQALAAARSRAKAKFLSLLSDALSKYKAANQGQLPPNPVALTSYFDAPIDSAILDRYALFPSATPQDPKYEGNLFQEKAPIDADYDVRFTLSTGGGWAMWDGPLAWIENSEQRNREAIDRYTKANHGMRPTSVLDWVPYFDPPLSPELIEKIRAKPPTVF